MGLEEEAVLARWCALILRPARNEGPASRSAVQCGSQATAEMKRGEWPRGGLFVVEEGARANENEEGLAQGVVGAGDEDSSAGGRDCGWESAERGFCCV